MIRICPSCNTNLTGFDKYFCTNCGFALPSELVNSKKIELAEYASKSANEKKALSVTLDAASSASNFLSRKHLFIAVVGVCSVLSLSLLFYFFRDLQGVKDEIVSKASPSTQISPTVPLPTSTPSLAPAPSQELSEFVPFNALAFIKSNDLDFVSEVFKSAYSEELGSTSYIQAKFKDTYGIYLIKPDREYIWNFVFLTADNVLESQEVKVKDFSTVSGVRVGSAYYISSDAESVNENKFVINKTAKSLDQNPLYKNLTVGKETETENEVFLISTESFDKEEIERVLKNVTGQFNYTII